MLLSKRYTYDSYSQGKLIISLSKSTVDVESLSFLQRIQGDIFVPINLGSGPFKYFMAMVDASFHLSHVCLLSTRNVAFSRLLSYIIKLKTHFPGHPIKSIRMDNFREFTSKAFDDYFEIH